jgi:hypothetical protein
MELFLWNNEVWAKITVLATNAGYDRVMIVWSDLFGHLP